MNKNRLEAFSDGVLAVAITIMILEIKVPHGTDFAAITPLCFKFLSYILRHEPQSIGLQLDAEGWASIEELISLATKAGKQFDRELLQQVVDTSDKKRFTISGDGLSIRAAQGHSSEQVRIDYKAITPPAVLYHGTATRFVESIRAQGLLPGQRQGHQAQPRSGIRPGTCQQRPLRRGLDD